MLVTIPISHYCEKARWALDRATPPLQVQALDKGIEPELVSERISELRGDRETLAEALDEVAADREEAEDEELAAQLGRVPDLSKALAQAPPKIQRQVFEAFDLQITYDKVEGRVEMSATVSGAMAEAFENVKALQMEGSLVVARDIAGTRYVPRSYPRIVQSLGVAAPHPRRPNGDRQAPPQRGVSPAFAQ